MPNPSGRPSLRMAAHGDEHELACSARRTHERRLRSWWRHDQFAIRCAVASATHHNAYKSRRVDAEAQTEDPIQQRTVEQIVHDRNMEQTVDVPVPQDTEHIVHECNMEQTVDAPRSARYESDRTHGARACRGQEARQGPRWRPHLPMPMQRLIQ